jgi:hypothetical protein
MTARINARLDRVLARKLRTLCKQTGQSTTEIVKASLESYYLAVTRKQNSAMLLSELVGCADGATDVSETYKRELTHSPARKNRR